jgi:tetratricopeptide (TPR) repeat protein
VRLPTWAAASAVLIAGALAASPAVARHHHHHGKAQADAASGRRHLKKADTLAEWGRCAEAVGDYTVAYEKLDDPVILFRRAQCYREIGERAKAVDDYRTFLEAQPDAPNRADIEARIAELERDHKRERDASLEHEEETTAPAASAAAAPVVKPLPAAPAKPAPAQPAAAVLVDQHAGAPEGEAPPDEPHGHWWIWTTVAVVVVGGAAAAYLLARPHPASAPPTTLGTYQF